MKFSKIIFVLALLFFSLNVQANILFLNFNKNDSSVQIVQQWAAKQNLKLFVFPNSSINKIHKDSIYKILKTVSDKEISKIILSGHSGSEVFSGKDGVLSRSDFKSVLAYFPDFSANITSVIARGCYSATVGDFYGDYSWQTLFPNLRYLAGHEGKAWSSETDASKDFIQSFLELEDDFLKVTSSDTAVNTYIRFDSHTLTEASVWVKSSNMHFYVSTILNKEGKGLYNFVDMEQDCQSRKEQEVFYRQEASLYYQGLEAGYERPPKDQRSGKMRRIYSWILQNKHCYLIQEWQKSKMTEPMTLMALLFYDKLISNYYYNINTKEFKKSLAWLSQILNKKINMPNLKTASRSSIRQFAIDLQSIIVNIGAIKSLAPYEDSYEFKILKYHSEMFYLLVSDLDPLVIPFRWLTEEYSNDKPLFAPTYPSNLKLIEF